MSRAPVSIPRSQRDFAVAYLMASFSDDEALKTALEGWENATSPKGRNAKAKSLRIVARLFPEAADDLVRRIAGTNGRVLHLRDHSKMGIVERNGRLLLTTPRRWAHLASYRTDDQPLAWTTHSMPGRLILAEIVRRGGLA